MTGEAALYSGRMSPISSRAVDWKTIFALVCAVSSCSSAPVPAGSPGNEGPAGEGPEPPLSSTTATAEGMPLPFGAFATLTEAERRIAAQHLRARAAELATGAVEVRVLPAKYEVCVAGDTEPVRVKLQPLLQSPSDVAVVADCRSLNRLTKVGPDAVRAEFVRGDSIDVDALWSTLINAFPRACGVEIDSSSQKAEAGARVRSFAAHARRIPTSEAFKGIVLKELIGVKLEAAPAGAAPGVAVDGIFLSVEGTLFWRRASASTWVVVKTIQELDPGMISASDATALGRCVRGLMTAVAR